MCTHSMQTYAATSSSEKPGASSALVHRAISKVLCCQQPAGSAALLHGIAWLHRGGGSPAFAECLAFWFPMLRNFFFISTYNCGGEG